MCSWNGDHHKPESSHDTAQIAISQTSGFCSQHGWEGLIFWKFYLSLVIFALFKDFSTLMELALCPLLTDYSEETVKLPVESIGLQVVFCWWCLSFHILTHFFRPRSGLQICWTWKSLTWNSQSRIWGTKLGHNYLFFKTHKTQVVCPETW